MNLNQFTIKAQEVIQATQQIAFNANHQQMDTAHLLKALMNESADTMDYIFKKNNVNANNIQQRNETLLKSMATVSADPAQ
jgi:ATP-dependent Clp protease ATP-binding subunit ClpB